MYVYIYIKSPNNRVLSQVWPTNWESPLLVAILWLTHSYRCLYVYMHIYIFQHLGFKNMPSLTFWFQDLLFHVCDMTRWLLCPVHDVFGVCHDPFTRVTWHIHMSGHCSYVWHDSYVYVAWLLHWRDAARLHVWHDWFSCVASPILSFACPEPARMCDMNHSHTWHDSLTYVTWLEHMCDVTRTHRCHDSFTHVMLLLHIRGMTHSHVRRYSYTYVAWLIHTCDMIQSFTCPEHDAHLCGMTHSHM